MLGDAMLYVLHFRLSMHALQPHVVPLTVLVVARHPSVTVHVGRQTRHFLMFTHDGDLQHTINLENKEFMYGGSQNNPMPLANFNSSHEAVHIHKNCKDLVRSVLTN